MRRLHAQELEAIQDEFVAYLIMEGIDKDAWLKLKQSDPNEAERLIVQFSHTYFKVMLSGIQYVTLKSTNILHTIFFRKKDFQHLVIHIQDGNKIAQKTEPYKEDRLKTIFDFLEEGFIPDKGDIYKELALIYAENIRQDR